MGSTQLWHVLADQSSAFAFEVNAVGERAKTSHDGQEECQEVQEGAQGSHVSINKKREVESSPSREHNGESKKNKVESWPQKERKDKGLSRRQSLAAAGTPWEAWVRRSTRIRSGPLEYWNGKDWCLAIIIGLKYMSPGDADGKPTMKVKSYVSYNTKSSSNLLLNIDVILLIADR